MVTNEQLTLKRSVYSAKKTIILQLITAVLALSLGFGLIFLLSNLVTGQGTNFSDLKQSGFLMDFYISVFILIFLIGYTTYKQFEEALAANKIFQLSLKIGLYCGLISACVMALLFILLESTIEQTLIKFTYHLTSSLALGLLVGLLQIARIKIEHFDHDEHILLLTNEADVRALKLEILPYRQKVINFWLLVSLLMAISLCYLTLKYLPSLNGISFVYLIFLIYFFIKLIIFISNPNIATVKGQVHKDHRPSHKYSEYIIICDGVEYPTDQKMWSSISDGRNYRLWLSNSSKSILAIEHLEIDSSRRNNEVPSIDTLKKW